jgi:hypothetical protein
LRNEGKEMKAKTLVIVFLTIVLVSCAQALTPAPTNPPQPTSTFTPEPTSTPSPVEVSGLLFLDANGSGLRDDTSFICPKENATSASLEYFFPNVCNSDKVGKLVTVREPSLSKISVCYNENCTTTKEDGTYSFILSGISDRETVNLKVTDPNAQVPELALKYFNKWNKAVVIPPSKTNGIDIPEQKLNDTKVFPLASGFSAKVGADNQMGLMQGVFTYPFWATQYPTPLIQNYFDILGIRAWDDAIGRYNESRDGVSLNYNGEYNKDVGPHSGKISVGDSHNGVDFLPVPLGKWIVNGGLTSYVYYLATGDEFRIILEFPTPDNDSKCRQWYSGYGHLAGPHIVREGQTIYHGQIIGVSGDTGEDHLPQLHYDNYKLCGNLQTYQDFFRYTVEVNSGWKNFWGNPISLLTVDNIFVYPGEATK